MLNKIIQTIFSKGIVSILNFLIVIITAKFTGAEGRGQMSLMYLNVTLILMINDLIGGSALVYLIPKLKAQRLVIPSAWMAVLCALLLPFLFNFYLGYDLRDYLWFTALSLMLNFSSVGNMFLNGLQKIRQSNTGGILQTFSLFLVLCFLIFGLGQNNAQSYYLALLIGYSLNFFYSLIVLSKYIFPVEKSPLIQTCKEILNYGFIVQAGNAIQLLNYRLSYYFLDYFFPLKGKAFVGVFSTGSSVAEAVWVIMNGISMVQYATLSNNENKSFAISYSVKLSKICLILTVFAVLVLILLPNSVFVFLFGNDFTEMRYVIQILSPGIVLMGFTGIYSHYFAGTGLMKISTYASLVAFGVTLIAGILLIPSMGLTGAALTSCLSYCISSLYLVIEFTRHTKCGIREQFFSFKDLLKLH
ncbi:MAG: teichoic acid transporter [Bacteroidetes bacterium]|jgi:O-antigen/teichoic acid export membrane protein|nr:teichoic acid transporter [Bacteroidota bacterium]